MTDIQDKISKLQDSIKRDAIINEKEIYESRGERVKRDSKYFYRFYIQFIYGMHFIWKYLLNPIRKRMFGIFGYVFDKYKKLWSYCVYSRNKFNELEFSKTRAGLMVGATYIFAYYVFVPIVVFSGDVMVYTMTSRNEKIYLTFSQEIDSNNNVHAVKGCYNLPCDDNNAWYFRIEPSAFNHMWKIFNNFEIFYPDTVASGVPNTVSECIVKNYGFRFKLLVNNWDIYPKILKVFCNPLTGMKIPETK